MKTAQDLCFCFLLWLSLEILPATTIPIDNGVTGTSVQCTSESIAVNFTTRNQFSGRIFVKGMSDKPECVRSYADGGPTPATPVITFTFGACNMLRSRTLSPQAGMMQMIVVVISFHKTFITKVDRAYKVQCFYTEAERTVTSHLEVSMLSTESLRDTQSMPSCLYEVRRGSRTGDIVRYASVGDAVYHEWECKSDQIKMLVKNCYVDDGQGNKQQVVDDKGCATDSFILSDLIYETSGNAKAWVESHVFKYADKPNLFFQCTIQLCAKGDPQCGTISPPTCQHHATVAPSNVQQKSKQKIAAASVDGERVIRSHPLSVWTKPTKTSELDLWTDSIAVLDLEDETSAHFRLQENKGHFQHVKRGKIHPTVCAQALNSVCMSTTGFAFLMAIMIALFTSTFISAAYIRLRQFAPCCRSTKKV